MKLTSPVPGLILCVCVGCGRHPAQSSAPTPVSYAVRVSSSDLFLGDLKRLEPHLGLRASGCVHLDIGKPDVSIAVKPEFWRDGKKLRSASLFTRGAKPGPADVSISLREMTDFHGKPQYDVTTAISGASGDTSVHSAHDAPVITEGPTGEKKLRGPVDLPPNKLVAVWAWLRYDSKADAPYPPASYKGSFEEAAKGAKWAVILKVGWSDKWNGEELE
jgi:hypothetical protein